MPLLPMAERFLVQSDARLHPGETEYPQHHPRYPGLALNHAWWLTNQRKKQNAAPFRDDPYTQSGRSFENNHQAPSAFQRACYTAQRQADGCFSKTK